MIGCICCYYHSWQLGHWRSFLCVCVCHHVIIGRKKKKEEKKKKKKERKKKKNIKEAKEKKNYFNYHKLNFKKHKGGHKAIYF